MSKDHARWSPSKLEALESCVCFQHQGFPDKDEFGESPADRGSRLHLVMESGDLKLCKTDEEVEQIRAALLYVEGKIKSQMAAAVVYKELKVSVLDYTYGTADLVILWPELKKGTLIDYKFVRSNSVSAPGENFQLEVYAAGVLEKFPEIQELSTGILAPTLGWNPPEFVYTRGDLPRIHARVAAVTAAAADPFKKPTPGAGDICPSCANAGRCPALGASAMVVAKGIGLPVPEVFSVSSMISPKDRAIGQVIARALTNWSEQVLKHNNEFGANGGELPGHSKIVKQGSLRVKDKDDFLRVALKYLTTDELLAACSPSFSSVAKAVAEKKGVDVAEVKALFEDECSEGLVRGDNITYFQRKKSVSDALLLEGKA